MSDNMEPVDDLSAMTEAAGPKPRRARRSRPNATGTAWAAGPPSAAGFAMSDGTGVALDETVRPAPARRRWAAPVAFLAALVLAGGGFAAGWQSRGASAAKPSPTASRAPVIAPTPAPFEPGNVVLTGEADGVDFAYNNDMDSSGVTESAYQMTASSQDGEAPWIAWSYVNKSGTSVAFGNDQLQYGSLPGKVYALAGTTQALPGIWTEDGSVAAPDAVTIQAGESVTILFLAATDWPDIEPQPWFGISAAPVALHLPGPKANGQETRRVDVTAFKIPKPVEVVLPQTESSDSTGGAAVFAGAAVNSEGTSQLLQHEVVLSPQAGRPAFVSWLFQNNSGEPVTFQNQADADGEPWGQAYVLPADAHELATPTQRFIDAPADRLKIAGASVTVPDGGSYSITVIADAGDAGDAGSGGGAAGQGGVEGARADIGTDTVTLHAGGSEPTGDMQVRLPVPIEVRAPGE